MSDEKEMQRYRVSKDVWTCGGLSLAKDSVFTADLFSKGALFKQSKRASLMDAAGVEGILKVAVARGYLGETKDEVTVGAETKLEEVSPVSAQDQAKAVKAAPVKAKAKAAPAKLTGGAK